MEEEFRMRPATKEERQSVADYINSICVNTGFNLWDLQEQVKIYDAYYNRGVTDGYNKAIDECKNIVIQTLDNEGLADTLLLRMENLKGEI